MKIGFFHITTLAHKNSGVLRYGKLLAQETRRQGLEAVEAEHILQNSNFNTFEITDKLRALNGIDVLHLQYNPKCWGRSYCHEVVEYVFDVFRDVPIFLNLHDVYHKDYPRSIVMSSIIQAIAKFATAMNLIDSDNSINYMVSNTKAYQQIKTKASRCILFDEFDHAFINCNHSFINPHFVESPANINTPSSMKSKHVIGFLGFAGWRKGIDIFLRAMKLLDNEYEFIVIGGQEKDAFNQRYKGKYQEYFDSRRLRATGFLSDDELSEAINEVDLAVCPFRMFSASGSLSTWIAHEIPVLSNELRKIASYNKAVKGSILTYKPNTPKSLADQISNFFDADLKKDQKTFVQKLKEKLSLRNIVQRNIEEYKKVLQHDNK